MFILILNLNFNLLLDIRNIEDVELKTTKIGYEFDFYIWSISIFQ